MPANRNALIRYKTIDNCLKNRFRKWTLENLIDACSEALYEYEGIDKGVSKRTVQADIQLMRSDKLGYNAPIVVLDKKYYTYEDPNYSITNLPISSSDLEQLNETVAFLKQFQGFSHFQELGGLVQKLEDHVYSAQTKTPPVIDFEKNENLKGLKYLDPLYQAIIKKQSAELEYQSFKQRKPNKITVSPYLLKETRNRWFVICTVNNDRKHNILNLALDRIESFKLSKQEFYPNPFFNASSYFKNAIGVTTSLKAKPQTVVFKASPKHAPYIRTKPLHWSQKTLKQTSSGTTFSIDVVHNFELERDLLSFGNGVTVLSPPKLQRTIKSRLAEGLEAYNTMIDEKQLPKHLRKLNKNGFSSISKVYTSKEINTISKRLLQHIEHNPDEAHGIRALLQKLPQLTPLLLNENMQRIINSIQPDAFLTKAIYFDKPKEANWFVSWHQDIPINVTQRINTPGFKNWTAKKGVISVVPPANYNNDTFTIRIHLDKMNENNGGLQVLNGSHKKQLEPEEIKIITDNSNPFQVNAEAGDILLMKPLLLHASPKSRRQSKRRVIHLEFSHTPLPNGLKYLEQQEV